MQAPVIQQPGREVNLRLIMRVDFVELVAVYLACREFVGKLAHFAAHLVDHSLGIKRLFGVCFR